jgi:hypothetical protein
MSMEPEWGTQRTLNGLPATENLPAGSMETLLVNQLVDGWSLDEGRVELNQWLRPEESAIQTRGDEPLYLSVTYLQEPLYICAVVPDEVFTVLENVHEMSFASFHIVWHSPPGKKCSPTVQSFSWQRIYQPIRITDGQRREARRNWRRLYTGTSTPTLFRSFSKMKARIEIIAVFEDLKVIRVMLAERLKK